MSSVYLSDSPLATLKGQCYFCKSSTPYFYKAVRLCYKHASDESKAVIDVQNWSLNEETKMQREVIDSYS